MIMEAYFHQVVCPFVRFGSIYTWKAQKTHKTLIVLNFEMFTKSRTFWEKKTPAACTTAGSKHKNTRTSHYFWLFDHYFEVFYYYFALFDYYLVTISHYLITISYYFLTNSWYRSLILINSYYFCVLLINLSFHCHWCNNILEWAVVPVLFSTRGRNTTETFYKVT